MKVGRRRKKEEEDRKVLYKLLLTRAKNSTGCTAKILQSVFMLLISLSSTCLECVKSMLSTS